MRTEHSFCRVCHASCSIEVDVDGNRVVAVRGVNDDPIFAGYTCIKGRQLPAQMSHPDRLRAPLVRRDDGTFEIADSASVLDAVAEKLQRIITEHGPRAVATYTGTGGYQNSVSVPTVKAFHKVIQSRSFYTSLTIDQPSKATAGMRVGMWEGGYHNFSDADVLMAIGYNPMVSSFAPSGGLQGTNPFVVLREAKKNGLKLIVIDPRVTELASQADIHLAVRPGEDPTLLAGIINIVIDEQLFDREFCERWVSDFDQFSLAVAPFTLDYVSTRCDVPRDDIVAAARMFAQGTRGTSGTGTGPSMAPHSSLTEHLSTVLNTICGRVNRAGDTVESGFFLYPDMPRKAQVMAPRNPASGAPARVRNLRGYNGEMPTATLAEEILTPGEGQIRALIVNGGNPVVAWPDQELTIQALQDLELLVVVDHRMSATAEFAHYVIAPTLSLERADVPHLMDRWFNSPYTNYTDAIVEKDGDVLNEWEVFWELARRLGHALPYPGGEAPIDPKPTDHDIIELAYAGSRMPIDEIRRHRRVVHNDRAIVVQDADEDCTARFTLAPADLMTELDIVRGETSSLDALSVNDRDYPFRLIGRRVKHRLNSLGNELPVLAAKATTNPAHMNPSDMTEHGIGDGDIIEITSPRSTMHAVVEAAPDVRRGVISISHSWGGSSLTDEKVRDIGSPTNRLVSTSVAYDPVTGMVVQSAIPVRVRVTERANV